MQQIKTTGLKIKRNTSFEEVIVLEEAKAFAREAAANYFRKDARINIRLSRSDLNRIKQMAAYEGLPYQTLIASLLHKYAAGHL